MQGRLHLGNLPDKCSNETLNDLFSPYGKIVDVIVIKNYGFVTYESREGADKAIKDLNKTKLLGNEISVDYAKQRSENRDNHDRNRRSRGNDDRRFHGNDDRRSNYHRNENMNGSGFMNPLAGILGAAPGGGDAQGLGLLNTITAAVAGQLQQQQQQQQQQNQVQIPQQSNNSNQNMSSKPQPDPDVRVRREVVHVRDSPDAAKYGLTSGYVIYERYYVDPSHPLLRGLPIDNLPRINDPPHKRDPSPRRSPPREREREREFRNNTYLQDDLYTGHRDSYSGERRESYSGERRDSSPSRLRDFDYQRY